MKTFKVGEIVIIKMFRGSETNERGRINHISSDGRYWVTNMNMPFQGTVSDYFWSDELEKVK